MLLAAGMEGGEEGEGRGVTVSVFCLSAIGVVVLLLDHLHYRDGTWLEFGQLGDSVKKA